MSTIVKAVPTVKQVAIIGEPLIGGTLSGSYLYENADENPEGVSTFCWYDGGVAGSVIATTIDLTLLPVHAGMNLTFSVTPVAATGEQGDKTLSESVEVVRDGFQNISDEESENSFLKQRGQFAFHANGPKDGVFTSTAGAFALKNRVTQNVSVIGAQSHGGTVPPELATYLQNNPAITMFTTETAFGALVPTGEDHNQLLVWGPGMPATLPNLQDIHSVYSNAFSLAFIYKDPQDGENTIGAVGTAVTGGQVPVEIQNKLMFDRPKAIYATIGAFAVLTEKGCVYAWGGAEKGGSIPVDVRTQLNSMRVERIVASRTAFCALTATGELIAWGLNGVIPAATLEKIYDDGGALNVIANDSAFVAITSGRRKAATWGLAAHGGTMSEVAASLAARGNLVLCAAAPWAMCFINESGQAAAWGSAGYGGGAIPAQSADGEAFDLPLNAQALLEQGTLTQIEAIFSDARFPKNLQERVSSNITLLNGESIELLRNDGSFVLLNRYSDGRTKSLISWGLAATGGTIPSEVRQTLMASRIRKIYCSNGAYAALVDQGTTEGVVITWGRSSQDGGAIPAGLRAALSSGVVEIYTIQAKPAPSAASAPAAFAARKSNNKYVTWGAHVKQEEFDPGRS